MNKPEQRDLDLTPFIGSGFDMESQELYAYPDKQCISEWIVNSHSIVSDDFNSPNVRFRPRLNKPQVLDDYSNVLVDGLVWNAGLAKRTIEIEWLEFIGVEAGSGLEDWAKRHGVPIVDWEAE